MTKQQFINADLIKDQVHYLMRGTALSGELRARMEQELAERLALGHPLKVKLGLDPTTKGLHIGHLSPLLALKRFQDLGHEAYLLLGGFTARIGDPSGQKKRRPMLSEEQIQANIKVYLDEVFRALDWSKTRVVNNATWFNAMTPIEFLSEVALHLSLARVMEHKDFSYRHSAGRPIGLHELVYPAAQAYDSMVLCAAQPGSEDDPEQYQGVRGNPDACCDVEVGGNDQLFNLTLTREMMRRFNLPAQIIITTPLIPGTDGQKMGKSAGNVIAFADRPDRVYRRIMAIRDELIKTYFTAITTVPDEEIEETARDLHYGRRHPRDVKQQLAREIVRMLYSEEDAQAAEREYEDRIYGRVRPEHEVIVPRKMLGIPVSIVDLVELAKLASSRSEAKRLLRQRGIRVNGQVAKVDQSLEVQDGMVIQRGQRRDAVAVRLRLPIENVQ